MKNQQSRSLQRQRFAQKSDTHYDEYHEREKPYDKDIYVPIYVHINSTYGESPPLFHGIPYITEVVSTSCCSARR